ncbi:hypothetical protein EMPG_11149 [Blastomyces silverae]|uniref:Uncharacterized protein n=1 Tax=Blastomyces silverae TaxID=2060906 RepID=A0A0H1B315_9EURO|nr:hypothetical protein EMPG_11149 [Blastomyces silverae]
MSTFTFGFGGDDIDDQDAENDPGPDDTGINAGIRQLHIAGTTNEGERGEGEERDLVEASCCDLDEMILCIFEWLFVLTAVCIRSSLVPPPKGRSIDRGSF